METTAAKNDTVEQLEMIHGKLDKAIERINQARGVLAAIMGARIPGEEINFEYMTPHELSGALWAIEVLLEQAEEACESAYRKPRGVHLQAQGPRAA